MKLLTPNGDEIVGTLEALTGMAVTLSFDKDGTPEYEGYTEVFWDNQKTVRRNGSMVYLDESGNEWTLDQLAFADDEDGED